jgi:23S rRNA (uracil1939-C5)-methyltransferase
LVNKTNAASKKLMSEKYPPPVSPGLATLTDDSKKELCPYLDRCGGCSLHGISYEEQLAKKTDFLYEAFLRAGIAGIPDIMVIPSQPFEYRSRIQLHRVPLGTKAERTTGKLRTRSLKLERKQETLCGFMTRNSSPAGTEIVPVSDCLIAVPLIRQALKGGRIIPPVDRDRFCVYAADAVILTEGRNSYGNTRVHQKEIAVDAGVFFQSNKALLELLIDEILRAAESADSGLPSADFYCGVGTFAVFLRDIFERVDMLESNKAALRIARENVRLQNVRFFGQIDTVWALNTGKTIHEPYGFAVVDPGRQGLSGAMSRFLHSNCEILCYVSCNPNALARDAVILLETGGLKLDTLSFYDFYPQTKHIESLAIFRRNAI